MAYFGKELIVKKVIYDIAIASPLLSSVISVHAGNTPNPLADLYAENRINGIPNYTTPDPA